MRRSSHQGCWLQHRVWNTTTYMKKVIQIIQWGYFAWRWFAGLQMCTIYPSFWACCRAYSMAFLSFKRMIVVFYIIRIIFQWWGGFITWWGAITAQPNECLLPNTLAGMLQSRTSELLVLEITWQPFPIQRPFYDQLEQYALLTRSCYHCMII